MVKDYLTSVVKQQKSVFVSSGEAYFAHDFSSEIHDLPKAPKLCDNDNTFAHTSPHQIVRLGHSAGTTSTTHVCKLASTSSPTSPKDLVSPLSSSSQKSSRWGKMVLRLVLNKLGWWESSWVWSWEVWRPKFVLIIPTLADMSGVWLAWKVRGLGGSIKREALKKVSGLWLWFWPRKVSCLGFCHATEDGWYIGLYYSGGHNFCCCVLFLLAVFCCSIFV